ncbi:MAG TPA: alanine--tRNA ligase-related protein [Nocardioidaceae bacterium]|nr:alanine--tRNA ligase-related protein [Nocardioidaceae bacterium]
MNTEQTRDTFLDFFRDRDHRRITGSTLLPPDGDRSVLFTTSGMHQLTPYLLGTPHPQGRRLMNLQRCLRTTDLEEVGDQTHLTVFGMLGSWSLGDYDGPTSLRWGYQLLTDGLGLDRSRLHVTVFGGDEQIGPDQDSLGVWSGLGVPVELTSTDNWWSNGPTGPCGPDSEIFVWTGQDPPTGTPSTNERWVEVWNHVMMRYHRHADGTLQPLRQRNVDTGMGLERFVSVLQGKRSVYDTDLFEPWTRTVGTLWPTDVVSQRLVMDHLRSSVVVLGDGVRPSNTGRGYVLRRLLRRCLTTLWREDPSRRLDDLPTEPIEHTLETFGIDGEVHRLRTLLLDEQERFGSLLRRGRRVLTRRSLPVTEDDYRFLHDTHGLPRDLVDLLLGDR